MSVVDEVKQRTDIAAVVGEHVPLTKAGRLLKGLCPFHSEKTPSFFVYPEQQSWHCFGACNTGGDVLSFVMKKQGMDFGTALRFLADRAGIIVPTRSEPEAGQKLQQRFYQANQAAAQYFHNLLTNAPAGEKARKYLASRGISPKTIADFQLGYALDNWEALKRFLEEKGCREDELLAVGLVIEGEKGSRYDRFRDKLMFPILDIRGRVIGFGARVLDDSLPKYVNSPQTPLFDKSGSLYGINLAAPAIRQQNLAVVVEGYMDVLIAHQYGFNNVIASMGTAINEKLITVIRKLASNLILALDPDAAGFEAMLRGGDTAGRPLEEDLAPKKGGGTWLINRDFLNFETKILLLPAGKDPDEVIKENSRVWQELVNKAIPAMDYIFDTVTAKLNLSTAQGQTEAVDKLLPLVAEVRSDIRRDHYVRKLADLIKIDYNKIETALSRLKPARKPERIEPEKTRGTGHLLLSNPLEEYCLSLLLQYPELKHSRGSLLAEHFEDSENREIFAAWQRASDIASLKVELDPTVHDRLDSLLTRHLLDKQIEQKYADCSRRLRERYLRSLEAKKAEILTSERQTGGTEAELAKQQEQGMDNKLKLNEILSKRNKETNIRG